MNVYTTLDLQQQIIAENEIKKALKIQDSIAKRQKSIDVKHDILPILYNLSTLSKLFNSGQQDLMQEVQRKKDLEIFFETVRMPIKTLSFYAGNPELSAFLSRGVRKGEKNISSQKEAEGALIAIEPKTGHIKAMVGGRKFNFYNQFNRAMLLSRQVGSVIKPFVYAIALEKQLITPSTLLIDEPISFNGYVPKNYSGRYSGETLARTALAKSINVVAVDVLSRVGIDEARDELAKWFRVFSDQEKDKLFPKDLTLALGSGSFSPLDVALAYAVLANDGREVIPKTIRFVTDANGEIIRNYEKEFADRKLEQQISEESAFLVREIIKDVFQPGGTAFIPSLLKDFKHAKSSFGKTGTTSNWTDAWFAGANKHLASVIWFGYDDNRSLGKNRTGGKVAAPTWIEFQKKALANKRILESEKPVGVVALRVCKQLGLLAGNYDKQENTYVEYFQNDNVPKEICNFSRRQSEEEKDIVDLIDNSSKKDRNVGDLLRSFQSSQ